ncbi:Class III chitinase [Fulvia fulva]|uniref:chitinase n=1 Tax=Passalora fulva TaxID=5499 RepID=A0A9Q8UVY2_PASFU|nr:Class III chitinase [Fulvia fulva]KAK4610444.1 Class III chitinase [Fulvia fulva]KAK4611032.1 Class III chitinase [Fulvia fulva]UJO24443.1 Class III chitinase [Fulvia fulva]WPV21792.1 Class III chitinase [Fulvia fulva]WPV36842.1 Class III chitinase [Fulvia fulva]
MNFTQSLGARASAAVLYAHHAAAQRFSNAQNLAVYWGQNSYGAASGGLEQMNISTYCQNANIDIIPMGFVVNITTSPGGQPQINFANQGYQCGIFPGTNLWNCPTYTAEINQCQQAYGKTILLSIGGATYHERGFPSKAAAEAYAQLIWNTFGPVNSSSNALRPFGSAVVDGFDLDLEDGNNYFRAFGLKLRALMNANNSKRFYLTAAPQCPYPDANLNPLLNDPNGAVPFDALFVQYYNNVGCDLRAYNIAAGATQRNFNFQTWSNYAKSSASANKNCKVFLGVPGNIGGAQSGSYRTAAQLKPIINYCKSFSNFGGVMVWDASQAYANKPFLADLKTSLKAARTRRRHEGGERHGHGHGRRHWNVERVVKREQME